MSQINARRLRKHFKSLLQTVLHIFHAFFESLFYKVFSHFTLIVLESPALLGVPQVKPEDTKSSKNNSLDTIEVCRVELH